MTNFQNLSELLSAVVGVSKELEACASEIGCREETLVEAVRQVAAGIESGVDTTSDTVRTPYQNLMNAIRTSIENWQNLMEMNIRGREFIGRFDGSLIISVYGKVKSGKSSLGNLLAGLPFSRCANNPYRDLQPVFRVHALAGDGRPVEPIVLDSNTGFPVDITECTDKIQEFTIGGLTWVDTPGLHSMTEANGRLAREYADHAELVVFLTSSDSPLRRSDLEELKGLLSRRKPILIAVSRFDTVEEDLDDAGNLVARRVAKGDQAKREQLAYIEQQVKESGLAEILQDRQYVFLSTSLARQAIERSDPELFEQSGMPALYKQLHAVLTEQAVSLKTQTPRRKFDLLVQELAASGRKLFEINEQTLADLRRRRQSFQGRGKLIVRRVVSKVFPDCEMILRRAESERAPSEVWQKQLADAVETRADEVLREEISEFLQTTEKNALARWNEAGFRFELPEMEDVYDRVSVSTEVRRRTLGEMAGGIVGSAIGGLLSGGTAAFLGGVIGAKIGGWFGGRSAGTETIRVHVGTNVAEIMEHVIGQLDERVMQMVTSRLNQIASEIFDPVENHCLGVRRSVNRLLMLLQTIAYRKENSHERNAA